MPQPILAHISPTISATTANVALMRVGCSSAKRLAEAEALFAREASRGEQD